MIELITFILFVFVSGGTINGVYEVTRDGKIFGFWERFWEKAYQENDEHPPKYRFPHWVRMPLSQCVQCMASFYGTIIFAITFFIFETQLGFYSTLQIILIFIAFLLCLICANYFIHKNLK